MAEREEGLISELPAFKIARRTLAHLTSLTSAEDLAPFFSTLSNAPLAQWGEAL